MTLGRDLGSTIWSHLLIEVSTKRRNLASVYYSVNLKRVMYSHIHECRFLTDQRFLLVLKTGYNI
jgi:hypothetical protein